MNYSKHIFSGLALLSIFIINQGLFAQPGGGPPGGGNGCPSDVNFSPGNSGFTIGAVVYDNSFTPVDSIICDRTGGSSPNIDCNLQDYDYPEDYIIVLQINGNTCFYDPDGELIPETPLPIELVSFEPKVSNNSVALKWTTASEIGNKFFTIERSRDGFNFEVIGEVDGAGNSSQELHYSFTDNKPFIGSSYYRLKQTDFNGKSTYFQTESIWLDGKNKLTVYPNPSKSGEAIKIMVNQNVNASSIKILDVTGKVVHEENINDQSIIEINKTLNKGAYIVSASENEGTIMQRLVVR